MKRCWLHIGMHKTGTTSVQQTLAGQDNPTDWKYLSLGGHRNMGARMYAMFSSRPEAYYWFKKKGDSPEEIFAYGERLRQQLIQIVRDTNRDHLIISGEAICLLDRPGVLRMHEFLTPLFDEIRVIGYVRAPIAFKSSIFQQRLKHGDAPFDFEQRPIGYRRRFSKFDDIFGRQNVILRKFEPEKFTHRCVVTDFCEQIGRPPPNLSSVVRMNESLCREACSILYAYRKFGPPNRFGGDALIEEKRILAPLLAMEGTRFVLSKTLVAKSLAREQPDLRWIGQRLGEPFAENLENSETEISNEEDLLLIDGEACSQFAAKFAEIHGVGIPRERIPSGFPADPREIAAMVQYAREICNTLIRRERVLKPLVPTPPKALQKRRPLRAVWRFFQKRLLKRYP